MQRDLAAVRLFGDNGITLPLSAVYTTHEVIVCGFGKRAFSLQQQPAASVSGVIVFARAER